MEPKQNHRSVERLLKTRGNIAAAANAAALRSIEFSPPHNATNEETIELLLLAATALQLQHRSSTIAWESRVFSKLRSCK